MDADGVEQVREGHRHPHVIGFVLELFQRCPEIVGWRPGCARLEIGFQELEFAIQVKDASAHSPTVDCLQQPDRRIGHAENGNKQHQ